MLVLVPSYDLPSTLALLQAGATGCLAHDEPVGELARALIAVGRGEPDAVNAGPRHFIADLLYEGIAALAGRTTRRAWRAHVEYLSNQVLAVARRDPGCRVLVAVNVRYCHHMRRALGKGSEIRIVRYAQL